ncbi:MAG: DNA polymerase III subunit delta [Myxococcales bacterium FL481]|nr:MAG: DNA polymerase III subunit delta [Myxococcales bacterium FL481]
MTTAVLLLWGADRGAILQAAQEVREQLVGGDRAALAAFNHERFEAPYLRSFGPVVRACAQVAMGAPQRLVEVSDPEDLGKQARGQAEDDPTPSGDPQQTLLAYVATPNPSTLLLLTSTGLRANAKLVKAVQAHELGQARRFELPDARDAETAIQVLARDRGVELGHGAAQALVHNAGASLGEALVAFENALAHAGTNRIEVVDVAAVVHDETETDVFALSDAIGRGDARQALALLAQLFARGEGDVGTAQRTFGLLVRHFRLLFTAKASGRDAVPALGLPPFIAKKYVAQARGSDEPRLRRAYAGLTRLDDDFKGGSTLGSRLPYLLMQRWVLDVCGALPGTTPR